MKTFGWRFGDFQIEIRRKFRRFFKSRLKFWSGSWFPDDDFASASRISRRRPLTPRREEEEETAVGVDFLAEADLTPLTPATIYHFPGTFSFSSREKAGTKFPRISFRSPTLHVSGTFRHNRAGWHRPEAFAFFLRLFPQYLLLLLFLQRNNGRRGGLFGRESQLRAEINSFTEREMFTFEFRPFSRNDFSTIPFDLSARPFP